MMIDIQANTNSGSSDQVKKIETVNAAGKTIVPSRVDSFSGNHTTSLIVAVLFIATLLFFAIILGILAYSNKISDTMASNLVTGVVSILTALIGFYAGISKGKNQD